MRITIETKIFETRFSDVAFNQLTGNLTTSRFDINAKSKYPPSIIIDIPNMVSKRLSQKIYLTMKKSVKKQNHCVKLH